MYLLPETPINPIDARGSIMKDASEKAISNKFPFPIDALSTTVENDSSAVVVPSVDCVSVDVYDPVVFVVVVVVVVFIPFGA